MGASEAVRCRISGHDTLADPPRLLLAQFAQEKPVGLLWGFSVAESRTNGPKATSRNPRFCWYFSFGMLLSSDTLGIHNPKVGGSIPPVATKSPT
jgi:hypothetical protein